ncbi:MAG: type II toxin-antitoxin system RelE/ParE family toxin [Deltaproteobacteria bacterium]|nr:type II toxin-antitoxin system RelE/ParE family toxin [Deltaproteobacteria bacterium]
MSYGLELSHQAKKTLKLLDKSTIKRIEKRFLELCRVPYDSRCSDPLEMGEEGEWKTRVGNWRIIYTIRENDKKVYIFSIEPRSRAYRRF